MRSQGIDQEQGEWPANCREIEEKQALVGSGKAGGAGVWAILQQ